MRPVVDGGRLRVAFIEKVFEIFRNFVVVFSAWNLNFIFRLCTFHYLLSGLFVVMKKMKYYIYFL